MTDTATLESVQEPAKGYNDLKFYFANLNTMFSIRNTLAVDMMTAMPAGSLKRRMHDISSVTKRIYAETTTPTVTKLLEQVENDAQANPDNWKEWDRANLAEMKRIHSHLSALPPDLYTASVQISNEGRKIHRLAMNRENWDEAQPYIEKVVDLTRRISELKQKKFDTPSPYRALLMGYASDISDRQMDDLYEGLLSPLKTISDNAQGAVEGTPTLKGNFSRKDQMWLNRKLLEVMGFDFGRGGLYISNLSPMTGGNPEDVRILVRCDSEETFLDSLEDTLYQGARGLYYQNLPEEWISQPVGQDQGAIMLNTMSILYQTVVGHTNEFIEFLTSRAEGVFKDFDADNAKNLVAAYKSKKTIKQTTVRNEADELSKVFHDILRYRIERDVINSDLKVKDIPDRWNSDCKELIGLEPETLARGALQNPDWFTGRFGFIPTNTLSHIMAAELYGVLDKKVDNLSGSIKKGELKEMGHWLKENVHQKGRKEGTFETMNNILKRELDSSVLVKYLETRYLED